MRFNNSEILCSFFHYKMILRFTGMVKGWTVAPILIFRLIVPLQMMISRRISASAVEFRYAMRPVEPVEFKFHDYH